MQFLQSVLEGLRVITDLRGGGDSFFHLPKTMEGVQKA